MHIIDRADWETGIAYDWKDKQESVDMSLPIETLRKQRQKLEQYDYIRCEQGQHSQNIRIMEWRNPRDYGTDVKNPRNEGGVIPLPSNFEGGIQGSTQVQGGETTPTYDSKSHSMADVIQKANKTVDAMLDQERKSAKRINYPKRESLPEPIRELIDAFVEVSGIKPISKEALSWLVAGNDWLEIGATAADVRGAFEYAKGKFSVMTPHSLTNTLRAYRAGSLKETSEKFVQVVPLFVAQDDPEAIPMPEAMLRRTK
jgi:hypothetical protein